jgi:hypothetical protein
MSHSDSPKIGTIGWHDLTVPNAPAVRDFYQAVVGWRPEPVDMGSYSDFTMLTPTGEGVAGVCHARGGNADVPPQWLMYVVVEDIDRSAVKCTELGGAVLVGPKPVSGGRFCVIRDPAGAVCALFQPPR